MQCSDLTLVRGLADTRATLVVWNRRPWPVLARWFAGALAITCALLAAVLVVATVSIPDPSVTTFIGRPDDPVLPRVAHVVGHNLLVLALHAMACVAGFIAGSSLPLEAERRRGLSRWVHDRAGPLAIAFVVAATGFSLVTQALVLGHGASSIAAQLGISPGLLLVGLLPHALPELVALFLPLQLGVSPGLLLVGLLPHALPELVALFLPLAAWMIASRRGDWHELLAATVVTVLVAVPLIVAAAFVEVRVTPDVLRALAG
jgi:hypothetical protein